MHAKLTVLDEIVDGYDGKKGRVETPTLRGIEIGQDTNFARVVDFSLAPEDAKAHFGKCKGKVVDVAISDTKGEWQGRYRFVGKVLSVSK